MCSHSLGARDGTAPANQANKSRHGMACSPGPPRRSVKRIMTHPDPDFRKVGELHHYWAKLVFGKAVLFVVIFCVLCLLGRLQENGRIGTVGTYAMIALALAGLMGLVMWDFSPSRHCPDCHAKMKRRRIRPKTPSPPSEEGMILCCNRCKTYIDLKVSID